jgi:hypothetical protein
MKIKSTCILLVALPLYFFCRAQEKTEKYCKISFDTELFGKKIIVNLGREEISFRDSTEMNNLKSVKNIKNEVDILDYMDKIGWVLVSSSYYRDEKEFYFRKKFDAADIIVVNKNQ